MPYLAMQDGTKIYYEDRGKGQEKPKEVADKVNGEWKIVAKVYDTLSKD